MLQRTVLWCTLPGSLVLKKERCKPNFPLRIRPGDFDPGDDRDCAIHVRFMASLLVCVKESIPSAGDIMPCLPGGGSRIAHIKAGGIMAGGMMNRFRG
jgi:hypothetical protein